MINSYFLDIGYLPDKCEIYAEAMSKAGIAHNNLNANIIMAWDGEAYLPNVVEWARAHDRHRLCYGVSIGPWETEDDIRSKTALCLNAGLKLHNVYLDLELGTAFFGSITYIQAIKILDEMCNPLTYFISPYTNALSKAAAKKVHNHCLRIAGSTSARVVIAPQDGVGASRYPPPSPVNSFSRYPGKAGFQKVVSFFGYLRGFGAETGDRIFYRTNLETFEWPRRMARKERIEKQIEKIGCFSAGGIGPCWCFYPELIGV